MPEVPPAFGVQFHGFSRMMGNLSQELRKRAQHVIGWSIGRAGIHSLVAITIAVPAIFVLLRCKPNPFWIIFGAGALRLLVGRFGDRPSIVAVSSLSAAISASSAASRFPRATDKFLLPRREKVRIPRARK